MPHGEQFKGSIVALVTPFKKDGEVDADAFQRFIEWQIDQGTHGLVVCGTTGESPTLSHVEHMRVVELCIEAAARRVPVMAGTGSNSTVEAIELTLHAKKAGADAALVVTPYYNKPSQEGMYQHYKALAECSDLPIFIYNIPGRCVVDMTVETMARLAKLPNIVGLKDATNDPGRPLRTAIACGDEFVQLSGEDATVVAYLAQGGVGCISVTANVAPKLCSMLHEAWQQGAMDTVRKLNQQLLPLHDAMFCEPSPAPAKYGASLLGHGSPEVRLPLVALTEAGRQRVSGAMSTLGLLH